MRQRMTKTGLIVTAAMLLTLAALGRACGAQDDSVAAEAAYTTKPEGFVQATRSVAAATRSVAVRRGRFGGFYIGMGLMEAWGDSGFTISGRTRALGRFTSVLEFPMDGTYWLLEAGIDQIGGGFGVHVRYGSSGNLGDTAIDTDYAWDVTSREYIKSISSTGGDNVFLTLDVSYRLYETPGASGPRTHVDVFGGYHLQDAAFSVFDVHTVVSNGWPADSWTRGDAATYDMEFRGLRVGLRGEVALGPSGAVSGSLAVLPVVAADGFGQWIAREKTVNHNATGWGLDLLVRYEHAFSDNLRVWGGVGYTRLEGKNGSDSQYRFGSELIGQASLDELESRFGFFMIGGEFRF